MKSACGSSAITCHLERLVVCNGGLSVGRPEKDREGELCRAGPTATGRNHPDCVHEHPAPPREGPRVHTTADPESMAVLNEN